MSIPKSWWKNLLIALGWALVGAFLAAISAGAERPSGYLLSGFFFLGGHYYTDQSLPETPGSHSH